MGRVAAAAAAVLGAVLAIGDAGPAAAMPLVVPPVVDPPGEPSPVARVVVVGVAGLRWEDVGWRTTPNLAGVAEAGSVGSLSVRSAPSVTCPAEGWLTLGAGTYAARRDPAAIDPDDGCGHRLVPRVEPTGTGARVPEMPGIAALNRGLRFDASPGWLGERLGCVAAVGEGAALAAATSAGTVARYAAELPERPADLRRFASACPATLVDAGSLPASPAGTGPRRRALGRFDDVVGRVRSALPSDTVLVVVGVAETDARQARLHVAAAVGPGFGPGWLRSTSTGRLPYVQLSDVAPTILATLGRPFPDDVAGRPFVGAAPGRPDTLAATRARLTDTDRRAVEHRRALAPFFAGFAALVAAVVLALAALLAAETHRAEPRSPGRGRLMPGLRTAAIGLAGVPAATFLANAVPWWRSSLPLTALAGTVALGAAAVLGTAWLAGVLVAPHRRTRVHAVTVAGLTVATFAIDAVTGAGLQMDSLLGYNPLVAGRFRGIGNIAFAVLGAAAVALAALLANGRERRSAQLTVAAVAVPVVAFDGLPAWGADFGGVLTLVPAFAVLGLLVARRTVTWRRVLAAGAGGGLVVGLVSWLDYLRPEASRSHFGRFVGSVLDGRGTDAIGRKLANSWELLLMGPHTLAGVGLAAVLALVAVRPPAVLRRSYAVQPGLRPMVQASLTLAAFGFALNDSGVAIPIVMSLVTVPLTLALCADAAARASGAAAAGTATPRRTPRRRRSAWPTTRPGPAPG